ncbi:glycosyltransferase family 2 protein [Cellulophaga baltica]|uniref:glycosyltransferase family 2 protein n=1 Tax=Cellulophaga baltica TaxID=76594 RepID=UPI0037C94240
MKKGLVSIITPSYNSEKFLKSTAESIFEQSYEKWEWLIVDDFSTDSSRNIIEELAAKDDRVKFHFMESNSGSGKTRNKAIEMAKGQYIAFLDSDDIWTKTKLEIQIHFMQKNNYAFSHTSYGFIDENGKIIKQTYLVSKEPVDYKMLLKRTEIGCLTAVYDAEIIGKMYMPDLRRKQDYALWLAILKKGFKSYPIANETAFYRQHSNSVTSNKFKLIRKHWVFLKKQENLNAIQATYYTICWGIGGFKKYYI